MDKLESYRSVIQKLLTKYYKMVNTQVTENKKVEASDRLAFDQERDQYLWFRFG